MDLMAMALHLFYKLILVCFQGKVIYFKMS